MSWAIQWPLLSVSNNQIDRLKDVWSFGWVTWNKNLFLKSLESVQSKSSNRKVAFEQSTLAINQRTRKWKIFNKLICSKW